MSYLLFLSEAWISNATVPTVIILGNPVASCLYLTHCLNKPTSCCNYVKRASLFDRVLSTLQWQNYPTFFNMIRPKFAVVTAVATTEQARPKQVEVLLQEV